MSQKTSYTQSGGGFSPLAKEIGSPKRYWELDFLRGLCVLLMIMDHFFFHSGSTLKTDVWQFAQVEFWQGLQQFASIYWVHKARRIIRYLIISLFFLICGISCTLSHNNALRGVKALFVGLVISMFTYLADSFLGLNTFIVFGVIHMLGCAMLLFSLFDLLGSLLQKLISRDSKRYTTRNTVGLWVRKMLPCLVGVIGLIVFFSIPLGGFTQSSSTVDVDGYLVEFTYPTLVSKVSISINNSWKSLLSMFLEFNNYKPVTADYFPIMPNAFVVLIGSGIGQLVYHTKAKNALKKLDGKWNKPVTFVGRHALIFYLAHALVVVGFLFVIGGIFYIFK